MNDALRAVIDRLVAELGERVRLDAPLGDTGHHSCNGWYLLEL